MPPDKQCPFCENHCAGERPMCTDHWSLTDAATRVRFIAAQQTYERSIYRGDSVDAFSQACDQAVEYVRARLDQEVTP